MTNNLLANRWREEGGYRDIIKMAFPLILSMGATSILHFIDRMFLTWYASTSVAASVPAGMLNFTMLSLFSGTAGYVSTFVAQYHGADRPGKIGPSLWQGLYLAFAGGCIMFSISFAAEPIFRFFGHPPDIQAEEVIYFVILSKGSIFPIATAAFSGFFSGRGRNWPIMWVSITMAVVNIILDYILIFGRAGFPEMGIRGAAIATVIAGATSCLLYCLLIFRGRLNRLYHSISGWRFDRKLTFRMIRFGLPSGVQFFIELSGFAVFILLVGRIGADELAATSITFNINSLAFMPMLGFGVAISVVVGQFQGKGRSDRAERSVYSGTHICFFYMITVAATYVFLPQIYIGAFAAKTDPAKFEEIRRFITIMLRFVALYTLFDTMNIVFASSLKGAGDTRFVMIMILALSIGAMTIPAVLLIGVLGVGIWGAWVIMTAYVILLGFCFYFRFLTGKWKSMLVIEHRTLTANYPEVPTTGSEV